MCPHVVKDCGAIGLLRMPRQAQYGRGRYDDSNMISFTMTIISKVNINAGSPPSPLPDNTDLVAVTHYGASAAPGGQGAADGLPEGDQEVVELYPVFLRKLFPESFLCLFRGLCNYVPPAVGNPVDMGIHANTSFSITNGKDEVCCFPPHAF